MYHVNAQGVDECMIFYFFIFLSRDWCKETEAGGSNDEMSGPAYLHIKQISSFPTQHCRLCHTSNTQKGSCISARLLACTQLASSGDSVYFRVTGVRLSLHSPPELRSCVKVEVAVLGSRP